MRIQCCISLILCLGLLGCCKRQKSEQWAETKALVTEWYGVEIQIPDGLNCYILGNDTVGGDLLDKECKLLVYVDSVGCSGCRLNLGSWKMYIDEVHPIQQSVGFLFVLQSENQDDLALLFDANGIRYRYFLDVEGKMKQVNGFPEVETTLVFLLDKQNRVILVGSPVENRRLWGLYREQISIMAGVNESAWPLLESSW